MSSVKFKKDSEEWNMFMDYWALAQKFWKPEPDNEKYWDELNSAVLRFNRKYHTDFSSRIGWAFLEGQMCKTRRSNLIAIEMCRVEDIIRRSGISENEQKTILDEFSKCFER